MEKISDLKSFNFIDCANDRSFIWNFDCIRKFERNALWIYLNIQDLRPQKSIWSKICCLLMQVIHSCISIFYIGKMFKFGSCGAIRYKKQLLFAFFEKFGFAIWCYCWNSKCINNKCARNYSNLSKNINIRKVFH